MSKRLFSQRSEGDVLEGSSKQTAIPLSKTEPDLVNGIPLSGEDYLLVVRRQANKCAKTVVAPHPKVIKKVQLPAHMQFFDNSKTENSRHCPIEAWKKSYNDLFRSYQKHMQTIKDVKTPHKEITSIEVAYGFLYSADTLNRKANIQSLSQHTILRLIKYHLEWLTAKENKEEQLSTIFQLLVYLDPVLTSKNISILRDLCRECISLRSSTPPTSIAPLNIIISIISGAFGQSDLN